MDGTRASSANGCRPEAADERDSSWEGEPRFRVYRYRLDHPASSWSVVTDDVLDADVLEVLAWAREQAGADGLFAVALVVDKRLHAEHEERGLVWLLGEDVPNASEPTEREQHVLEAMLRRRDEHRRGSPRTV